MANTHGGTGRNQGRKGDGIPKKKVSFRLNLHAVLVMKKRHGRGLNKHVDKFFVKEAGKVNKKEK